MRPRRGERGVVAVLVALLLVVFVGVLAVVLDLGHLHAVKAQLQNAADSAALAGTRGLYPLELQDPLEDFVPNCFQAEEWAANMLWANQAAGEVAVGRWDLEAGAFIAQPGCPADLVINSVQVTAWETVNLTLARLFGLEAMQVGASAVGFILETEAGRRPVLVE
jgi:uncharacterized membrane protein